VQDEKARKSDKVKPERNSSSKDKRNEPSKEELQHKEYNWESLVSNSNVPYSAKK
jgi:hypothetical protein